MITQLLFRRSVRRLLWKRTAYDWSYNPWSLWPRALSSLSRSILLEAISPQDSHAELLETHRLLQRLNADHAQPSRLYGAVENRIRTKYAVCGREDAYMAESGPVTDEQLDHVITIGGLVLKRPRLERGRLQEKGAVIIKYAGIRFLPLLIDMSAFLEHYYLIIEPSWSGYASESFLHYARYREHPIIIMAPEPRDFDFIKRLECNLLPVSYGCSDWVNPTVFRPLEDQEKIFDAVMVARWAMYKRHHVLFRAIREIGDDSFKVALLGMPPAERRRHIDPLINAYQLRGNLQLYERRLPQQDVNRIINQSKVIVLLSLQEGGNKALFEGFFAGVPGLALKKNMGLPKSYFNSQTGRLVDEKDLGKALLHFREHYRDYEPRAWAEANIAPEVTIGKLNRLLKGIALQRQEMWTQDLVAKCNCPKMAYYPDEGVGKDMPSMRQILERYAKGGTPDRDRTMTKCAPQTLKTKRKSSIHLP